MFKLFKVAPWDLLIDNNSSINTDIMNFLSIDCSTSIGPLFVKTKNKTFSQVLQSDKSNNDLLMKQILDFFKEKSFNADEGKKFFEHYEANDWKTSDGKTIRDWQALAKNWMDRTELFAEENKPNKKGASPNRDNLKTTKTKDYGQPL